MNESGEEGIEKSKCRQPHTDTVNHKGSHKILHDRAMAAPRDLNRLHKLGEFGTNQYDIGTFARHVRARPHCYSDCGLRKSGCIIDSVSHHCHNLALGAQLLHSLELLLRE